MANPAAWRGLKYPDSDLVGLIHRFARPGRDFKTAMPPAIDVGCGSGRHVRLLEEIGFRAMGIDSDPRMCAAARENGIQAVCAGLAGYRPAEPPALVVCWGISMLAGDFAGQVAAWRPEIIIADWRTSDNSCLVWSGNKRLPSGAVRLHRPGHLLHGQEYWFYDLTVCEIPGYERQHWQQVTKMGPDGEKNDWFQTVHRRANRQVRPRPTC